MFPSKITQILILKIISVGCQKFCDLYPTNFFTIVLIFITHIENIYFIIIKREKII